MEKDALLDRGVEIALQAIRRVHGEDAAAAWRFGVSVALSGVATVAPVDADKFKAYTQTAITAVLEELLEDGKAWVVMFCQAVAAGERSALLGGEKKN